MLFVSDKEWADAMEEEAKRRPAKADLYRKRAELAVEFDYLPFEEQQEWSKKAKDFDVDAEALRLCRSQTRGQR